MGSFHLAAALYLLVAPSNEQSGPVGDETKFISTFTEICLSHMGDSAGQIATASAEPWEFKEGEKRSNGMQGYIAAEGDLGVSELIKACAFTKRFSKSVTLGSMQVALSKAIGTDQGQKLSDNARYWLIAGPNDEQFSFSLKVSGGDDSSLVTLWVQPRATLSSGKRTDK